MTDSKIEFSSTNPTIESVGARSVRQEGTKDFMTMPKFRPRKKSFVRSQRKIRVMTRCSPKCRSMLQDTLVPLKIICHS